MQNKQELQRYINDVVLKYNAFYEYYTYSCKRNNFYKQIPLLNYIEKNLNHKYGIRTAWSKDSLFYIVNYDVNKSDLQMKICRESNGVILDKKTNTIVCFIYDAITEIPIEQLYKYYVNTTFLSMQYCDDLKKFRNKPLKFISNTNISKDVYKNIDDYNITELYDGTLIKLFNYNNKWHISTNKCIDAAKSRWTSDRSYLDLFNDIPLDKNMLNPNYSYAFVLIHPENRMICKYYKPMLIHLGTFDLIKQQEINECNYPELDLNNVQCEHIFKPKTHNFTSLNELLQSFDEINKSNKHLLHGYFLTHKKTLNRIKIVNPKYKYLQCIKGNSRNMLYRIISLQKHNKELTTLLNFFPEHNELNLYVKSIIEKIVFYIYTQWYNSYVNNITPYVYPEFLRPIGEISMYLKETNTKKEDATIDLFREIILKRVSGKKLIMLYTVLTNNVIA